MGAIAGIDRARVARGPSGADVLFDSLLDIRQQRGAVRVVRRVEGDLPELIVWSGGTGMVGVGEAVFVGVVVGVWVRVGVWVAVADGGAVGVLVGVFVGGGVPQKMVSLCT